MIPQSEVDAHLDHARRAQAALKAAAVDMANRRAAYELQAQFTPPPVEAPPARELPEGMGAITWLGIAVCFALGFALMFVCGPWSVVAASPWTVGGTVGGGVLMVLGTVAAGKMARRR